MAPPVNPSIRFMERHAEEVSIILAELAESAGKAGSAWSRAVSVCQGNPDVAMTRLAEAHVRLHDFARVEVRDALRLIDRAMRVLEAELGEPDEDD